MENTREVKRTISKYCMSVLLRHADLVGQTYLHHCSVTPTSHDDGLFFLEGDSPHSFSGRSEFPNQLTGGDRPDLDPSITATTHDAVVVELQAGNAVVMRGQSMNRLAGVEVPNPDRSVTTTRDQDITSHLKLAYQAGMSLTYSDALTIVGIPNSYTRVQAAGRDSSSVKCHRVDLTEMTTERPQVPTVLDAPNLRRRVVATRDDEISMDGKTSHARLVTSKNCLGETRLEVPNTERGVAGSRDCRPGVGHLKTTDGTRVPTHGVNVFAGGHVPHPDIAITTATDQYIIPRHHRPHTHDVPS